MRLTAYRKYGLYLSKFGTKKKINNLLQNRNELKNKAPQLKSYPYNITIDPCSNCNLTCTGCHTGIKHPDMIKGRVLRFNNFTKIFDQFKDYLFSVSLYNWGEPLLNKEIGDIISYAGENKVGTTMHSNLNLLNEEIALKLIRSKLTHLYLSIDGASQETYSIYRRNGNYDTVVKNLGMLLKLKKLEKSKFPLITWKYLEFPHNSHEINKAAALAKRMKVNNFETFWANQKLMDIKSEGKEYALNKEKLETVPGVCSKLWNSAYIGPDGTLFPCSLCYRKEDSFGNLLTEDIKEIRNNEKYLKVRCAFSKDFNLSDIPLPCSECKYFVKLKN